MRDAIATTELFAEEPGQARRSFIIAIARPEPDEDGWRCRIKMTGNRVDRTVSAADSLHALARALDAAREALAELEAQDWRFFATREATVPLEARRFALP